MSPAPQILLPTEYFPSRRAVIRLLKPGSKHLLRKTWILDFSHTAIWEEIHLAHQIGGFIPPRDSVRGIMI